MSATVEELNLIERTHFTGHPEFSLEKLRANRSRAVNSALRRAENELKSGNLERAQGYVELAAALLADN